MDYIIVIQSYVNLLSFCITLLRVFFLLKSSIFEYIPFSLQSCLLRNKPNPVIPKEAGQNWLSIHCSPFYHFSPGSIFS